MPAKVELLDDCPIVAMTSSGGVSRREMSWALETIRELVGQSGALGVLIDVRDIDVMGTPSYAAEIVEDFAFVLTAGLPIALLPPLAWTDRHFDVAWKLAEDLEINAGVFQEVCDALDWLKIAALRAAAG